MKEDNYMKTGTTTVGIVCSDGVVLAADKRATTGGMSIVDKKAKKISFLTDHIAVTWAGVVSDVQLLVKYAESELRLRKIRTEGEVSVKEAANLMARMVYGNIRKMSMIQGVSHFIMGGKDNLGFHIYDIFPDGSITECDSYIASGSGSDLAYGVFETLHKEDMTVEEGIALAIKCVNAAIQRDAASGNGIDVVTITKMGVQKVMEKELNTRIEY